MFAKLNKTNLISKKMKLSKKIIDKVERGDKKFIQEGTGLSKPSVINAFKKGRGSRMVITKIQEFCKNNL